jgi:hypothetical protein
MLAPVDHSSQASCSRWLGPIIVGFLTTIFVLNNVAPYTGWPHVGAFTMFSGLLPNATNHLFLAGLPLGEAGTYHQVLEVRPLGAPSRPAEQFARFTRLLNAQGTVLHINLVRYQVSQICAAASGAGVRLVLRSEHGQVQTFEDVCAEPTMLRYHLVTHYPPCRPSCLPQLRLWIIGQLPDG